MAPAEKLHFVIDKNLPLYVDRAPLKDQLAALHVECEITADLVHIDEEVANKSVDIAYLPSADYQGLVKDGLGDWKALVMLTSKLTGSTRLNNVMLVRKDDSAQSVDDLKGAKFGYINKSCTSSWYSPAIVLQAKGTRPTEFFDMHPVKAWQGQIDALVAGDIRATMTMRDVYESKKENADNTRILAEHDSVGAVICVRCGQLSRQVEESLTKWLIEWRPDYSAEFGPFRPFTWADVHQFFHELDALDGV